MIYLLDTDILSNLLKPAPPTALIVRLAAVPAAEQATSSITVGELIYGAACRGPQAAVLLARIEVLLLPNLPVLPFDDAAARRYGTLRAELEAAGTPLAEPDLRIASIALTHDLTLVTGNLRHFGRISGLAVENWLV